MARHPAWALGAVALLAVLTRLALIVPQWDRPPADPDLYLPLAQSLAAGRGYTIWGEGPTAFRPPLYPLALAPLVLLLGEHARWGAVVVQALLGGATVVLTAAAAWRWGLSRTRCLLAAALVALDPVLAAQSRAVMTETLAAFLVALTLAGLGDGTGLGTAARGGLGFGLAALCRPSLLPAAGLSVLGALLCGPGGLRDRVRRAGALALATLAVLAPWAVRNRLALGEFVWTTTHGGYTLALANNDIYYDEVVNGPRGAVWSGPRQSAWFRGVRERTVGLTEPAADRLLRDEAVAVMFRRPGDAVRAAGARLGRLWGVAPAEAVYPAAIRLATTAWTVPLWILLVVGLVRRDLWRWPTVTAPAFLLALTAVHVFYWTDLRMRAPIVPAIALIAAGARGWSSRS